MTKIKRMLLLATAVSACASAALAQSEWTTGTISYDGAGNIVAMGQDVYLYDSAGRLVRGTANQQQSGVTARQDYSYDAYGNRLNVTTTGTTCVGGCASSVSVDATTNRVSGATYDAAGNMTAVGASSYTYDGAGMMSHLTSGTTIDWQFVYTAEDERLATYTGQGNWNFTVRDVDAKVLREVTAYQGWSSTTWTWSRDHLYRDGVLLASVYPFGQREQFHVDHLGTSRVVTDANGARIGTHAYYPFGDELALNTDESPLQRLKFTGHERDGLANGTPLDYLHARFASPVAGRFLSVDPVIHVDRAMSSPQMWNRYSYAVNNPMVFTDPTGTTVYLVTYTTGNSEGDDEFKRAAQTRAAAIQHQKGYDPNKDTVLVRGVRTKADFANAIKEANGLEKTYGKVGNVSLFSHAGWRNGPVFHDDSGKSTQFTMSEVSALHVNWAQNATASFYGCNTALCFSGDFAARQGVPTYGFFGYASFSSSPDHYSRIQPTGPVYMMTVPPHQLREHGMTSPWPMVRTLPPLEQTFQLTP